MVLSKIILSFVNLNLLRFILEHSLNKNCSTKNYVFKYIIKSANLFFLITKNSISI